MSYFQPNGYAELFEAIAESYEFDPTTKTSRLKQDPEIVKKLRGAEEKFVSEYGFDPNQLGRIETLVLEDLGRVQRGIGNLALDN